VRSVAHPGFGMAIVGAAGERDMQRSCYVWQQGRLFGFL